MALKFLKDSLQVADAKQRLKAGVIKSHANILSYRNDARWSQRAVCSNISCVR
jgi:hypothetical protein